MIRSGFDLESVESKAREYAQHSLFDRAVNKRVEQILAEAEKSGVTSDCDCDSCERLEFARGVVAYFLRTTKRFLTIVLEHEGDYLPDAAVKLQARISTLEFICEILDDPEGDS